MRFDDPAHHRQTQADPAPAFVWPDAEKLFEHALLGARRQSRSAIGNADLNLMRIASTKDFNFTSLSDAV